jgi:hypothetical protein
MQILITESQFNLLKEGIDLIHFVKNLFSNENIKRFKTEGKNEINEKIQKIVDLIWKVMSKTKEYQSLKKIKKYLTRVFVHKSSLSGSGGGFATDIEGVKNITWDVVILLDFKSYFNPKNDPEFMSEFSQFKELFNDVSEKMGIKRGDVNYITSTDYYDNNNNPVNNEINFHIYI